MNSHAKRTNQCPFCEQLGRKPRKVGCEHLVKESEVKTLLSAYWTVFAEQDIPDICSEALVNKVLLQLPPAQERNDILAIDPEFTDPTDYFFGPEMGVCHVGDNIYTPCKDWISRWEGVLNHVAREREKLIDRIYRDYDEFESSWLALLDCRRSLENHDDEGAAWVALSAFSPTQEFATELLELSDSLHRSPAAILYRLFQSRGGHNQPDWQSIGEFERLCPLTLRYPERICEVTDLLRQTTANAARTARVENHDQDGNGGE